MNAPTPQQIKAAREAAGLTQTAAAKTASSALRTWQQWEAGDRQMHPGLWELFLLKTGQVGKVKVKGGESD